MNCAEFKELAALLALGALDGEERAACEAHLAANLHHEGCLEALSLAMESVASLENDLPAEPPGPHVWAKIERQIAPAARRLRRARRQALVAWGTAFACAAAVLVVLWLRNTAAEGQASAEQALIAAQARERVMTGAVAERDACRARLGALEEQQRFRSEAVALLQLPGTQLFPLAPSKGATAAANAIIHTGVKRAYVVTDGLKPVPDHDYEMWIAKGDRVVPAGLVSVDEQGRAVVKIDYAALLGPSGAPDAVMVTLEPRGGSQVVRGPTVLLGSLRT